MERDLEQARRVREAEHERRQKERQLKKLISSRVGTLEPNVSTRRTTKLKEYRWVAGSARLTADILYTHSPP